MELQHGRYQAGGTAKAGIEHIDMPGCRNNRLVLYRELGGELVSVSDQARLHSTGMGDRTGLGYSIYLDGHIAISGMAKGNGKAGSQGSPDRLCRPADCKYPLEPRFLWTEIATCRDRSNSCFVDADIADRNQVPSAIQSSRTASGSVYLMGELCSLPQHYNLEVESIALQFENYQGWDSSESRIHRTEFQG
jgi:hypothetical protein